MQRPLFISLFMYCLSLCPIVAQDSIVYDIRSGLSHWIVSDVLQDRQGFMWFATWNGLNRFDGYEFVQIKVKPGDGTNIRSEVIREARMDEEGNIVCRTDAGLFRLDLGNYQMEDVQVPAVAEMFLSNKEKPFKDNESNLWKVGRYGVTKIHRVHNPAQLVHGTEKVQARAFFKDKDHRWWLATKEDECIRIYDNSNTLIGFLGQDGCIHSEKTAFGYRAYNLFQHSNGDIWIGCKPGALLRLQKRADGTYDIARINVYESLNTPECDIVYHMAEDSAGRLWIASFGGGVYCLPEPEVEQPSCITFTVGNDMEKRDKVRRILLTDSGHIICATTNGLLVARIDQENICRTTFRRLVRDGKREASLCNNATMDVCRDKEGRIFIATENNGIDMITEESLFSEIPQFTHFNQNNSSLTSDACLAMTMREDGHLFVVCTDRVIDFCPDSNQTVTYSRTFWNKNSHFSEERPLQLFDGSWLFGQEQGAYIASQHSLQTRGYIPPLVFTKISINGQPSNPAICLKDTLVIQPEERNFSLSFAALDYTDNSNICYRTRLNHSAWSGVDRNRSLTFFDLQPGEHFLAVQSTDRYGRWIDNTRELLIVVLPRWYETVWARYLGGLLTICIITIVVASIFYVRNLHRQRRELLERYMTLLGTSEKISKKGETTPQTLLTGELKINERKFLERVTRYIEENISNSDANIDDMASQVATSRSSLNRKLRSLVGITATQLLIEARMQKAKQLLQDTDNIEQLNITDIAFQCGYADAKYFSRCFKQKFGSTPTEFVIGK